MGKLVFRYGAMNSAKTASLCMMAHNFRSKNCGVVIIKPALDTRWGEGFVRSRAELVVHADVVAHPDTSLSDAIPHPQNTRLVLVDEAQFLTPAQIAELRELTRFTTVVCYGLRTDYRGRLFPAAQCLFELADTFEEIKTPCSWCPSKAILNAKFCTTPEGVRQIVREGESVIDLGAEDKYCALCWKCWVG